MAIDTNAVEVTWTAVALLGVAVHVRGSWYAYLDRATLLGAGTDDDALRMLATGRLRGELVRMLVDVGFAGIGVYSMFQPDAPHRPLIVYVIASVFIACVVLLVLNAILDDRERQMLRRYVSGSRLA